MSSRLGRPVPWRSWEEWEWVRAGLMSDDPSLALEKVRVWRCRGRIPLSVDSYASLLEIERRDGGSGNPDAGLTMSAELEMQLRLQYGMAIVRLVNGISDSSQKGKVANSVAVLATKSGMPRVLVDVRHEAAHNELPSLSLLRVAARQALQWLRHYYWDRQAASLRDTQAHITSLLQELVEERRGTLGKAFHGAQQAESEEEADETEAGLLPPDEAAKGSKRRNKKQIVSELKELIHPSYLGPLVDCILDQGPLPPPPSQTGGGARTLEEAVHDSTMDLLCSGLPDLRPGILVGAASRLTRASQTHSTNPESRGGEADEDRAWLAWVQSLLGGAARKQKRKGEGGSGQQWRPSTAQVRVLLAACLQPGASESQGDSQVDAGRVGELQSLLSGFLRRHAALLNQDPAPGTPLPHSTAQTARAEADEGAETVDAEGELGKLRDEVQLEMEAQLLFLQEAARAKRARVSNEHPSERSWQRAESWKACALGNLPSVNFDNGEPSKFEGHQLCLL